MPTYLQGYQIGSAGKYYTRGEAYTQSSIGIITVADGHSSDVLDLITAGCRLLDTSGPAYYRLMGTPGHTYTAAPSGATYTADGNGLVLIPFSASLDADSLVSQGCVLNGAC
jgi:hypothetical protein